MKYILSIILCLSTTDIISQTINAVTQFGQEVELHDNGTWNYLKDNSRASFGTNNTSFKKSPNSSFLVKSKIAPVGVWINTSDWKFNNDDNNDDSEYFFEYQHGDLYGMAIVEELEIPIDNLAKIALENAKYLMNDIQVVTQEYRFVNGQKVLFMEFGGSVEGMQITYDGYYYSDLGGTIQLIVFTGTNLVNKYKNKIEEFLNGLVSL